MDQQQPAQQQVQEEKKQPVAPFPAPPPFWKHFTTANIARLEELEASHNDGDPPLKLPLDLTFLRPPLPPSAETQLYHAFDVYHQVDFKVLPPAPGTLLFDPEKKNLNHAVLLTQLTKSVLLNFLELLTILSASPSARGEKVEDIRRLMTNIHVVINMYRPHQARESVKEMLQEMLEDGQKEMERCDAAKERVHEFLEEVQGWQHSTEETNGTTDLENKAAVTTAGDERLQQARRLWKMVHEIADE